MKSTITKLTLASTVLLTAAPALTNNNAEATTTAANTTISTATTNTATTSTAPYYNWNGYTGITSDFVLNKQFKDALLNGDVTMNGLKVSDKKLNSRNTEAGYKAYTTYLNTGKLNSKYLIKKLDTVAVKDKKNNIARLYLPIEKNKITMAQVKKIYGTKISGSSEGWQEGNKKATMNYGLTYTTKRGFVEFKFNNKKVLTNMEISAQEYQGASTK